MPHVDTLRNNNLILFLKEKRYNIIVFSGLEVSRFRVGFVERYCVNLILSWNILVSPFVLIESFAGYSNLG